MKDNQQILGTEPIGKLLIKYSVPAIIGMLVNGLYNVVDRIFIGNIPGVGPLAIAGLGVTTPIMTIIIAFGMLIGIGTTTNISIKLGQGKKEEAERLIGNAMTLAIVVGLLISVIGLTFQNQILSIFGASEGSLPYAKAYIGIILFGSVFNLLGFVFNSTIRGDGNPKLSATIMVTGCITNIVLDAILIMILGMGIEGAAIATVVSQLVTAIWGLSYYLRGKSNLSFKSSNLKLSKTSVVTIFAIGSAPFAMQIAASCVQIICNNSLRTYGGDLAIGAMATINSIIMLVGMPIVGISQGAQPIIGFNYGAKNYDRAKKTFVITTLASTTLFIVGALAIQLAPQVLVGMFNKDAQLMSITVNGLRKYTLALPLIGVSIVGTNYIQSTGRAKMAMVLSLLRQVIVLIPMILILPKFLGLDGVWFAQPTADAVASILTAIVIFREFKSYEKAEEVVEEYKAV